VVRHLKDKSAIARARRFRGRERNFTGEVFWARGYFVSTVGLDEEMLKRTPVDRRTRMNATK
jgi:putative transposase